MPTTGARTEEKRSEDKARQLLRSVLPECSWAELENKGVIRYTGKRGTYVISPYSQTEIREPVSHRCVAYACLQLSIPAPAYDRMVAEYLLIKNAEDVYRETANIFPRGEFRITALLPLLLTAFDIVLFANMLLEVLTVP